MSAAYAVNVEQGRGGRGPTHNPARFYATVDRSGSTTAKRGYGSGYTEREAIRKAWTDFWRANG